MPLPNPSLLCPPKSPGGNEHTPPCPGGVPSSLARFPSSSSHTVARRRRHPFLRPRRPLRADAFPKETALHPLQRCSSAALSLTSLLPFPPTGSQTVPPEACNPTLKYKIQPTRPPAIRPGRTQPTTPLDPFFRLGFSQTMQTEVCNPFGVAFQHSKMKSSLAVGDALHHGDEEGETGIYQGIFQGSDHQRKMRNSGEDLDLKPNLPSPQGWSCSRWKT